MIDAGRGRVRRRVLIIFNPVAGWRRWRGLERVLDALAACGCEAEVRATGRVGDAVRFAGEASPQAYDAVVAAGGDGTINEVVNGLAGSPLPLALIPLGTANVLAAEIGLGGSAAAVAATIAGGPVQPVHVGIANGRRFVMMAGAGFDAQVVASIDPRRKKRLGKAAYVLESLVQMLTYRYPALTVTIDGTPHAAVSAVVAKGHFYGGRHVCAPAASLLEPGFQVCLFLAGGPLAVLRYGAALLGDRLAGRADVRIIAGRTVEIAGPAGQPVQGDGDVVAALPVAMRIAPDRLPLIVPPESALLTTRGPAAAAE